MKKKHLLIVILTGMIAFACCGCLGGNVITTSDDSLDMSKSDYKAACKAIEYDDFRYEADMIEKQTKIKCTGEVEQICSEQESDSSYYSEYRIAITKDEYGLYEDDIYVYYMLEDNPKLLEEDIVTVYGEVTDSVTYTTVQGAERTVPAMVAVYVDIED